MHGRQVRRFSTKARATPAAADRLNVYIYTYVKWNIVIVAMLQTRNNLAIAISPPVGGTSLRTRRDHRPGGERHDHGRAVRGQGTAPFAFSEITSNLPGSA
jgi:hypothetical protein